MSLSYLTKELLTRHQIHPQKKLGQNFLIDPAVLDRILSAANLKKNDVVLEIGTGLGTLTKVLAEKVKKVITVEVDPQLLQITINYLKDYKNIKYINQSILEYKIPESVTKVVANLPYYITTPIISKLLKEAKMNLIVLTIQAELAERIVAKPGGKDYGSFSVFVQAQAEAKVYSYIQKSAFIPQPEVTSAVLTLKPYKKILYKINFDLVRSAFNQRRKTLKNALKKSKFKVDFMKIGIDPERRAETLNLREWAKLTSTIV